MSVFGLKALTARIGMLRHGSALRFGPAAVVLARTYDNLLLRLRDAERSLVRSGKAIPAFPLELPKREEPAPDRRSVVFLHNCYYNFLYLARALRRRGWDAVSVSVESPNGPDAKFYHGEDVNLYDPDPLRYHRNIVDFFLKVEREYRMVHFYGQGRMSWFPSSFDGGGNYDVVPVDFMRLRQLGIKIGYSVSGCMDGVAQSSVGAWSGSACARCIWHGNPVVCGDRRNLAWGHKVHMFCDLFATEGFPALDWQGSAKTYREPLTTALDAEFWRPDLEVPERWRLPRAPGEFIVYHAVGNFELRTRQGKNIKGTGAVIAAIERLRAEGMNVRLEFVTGVPNTEVRFVQVQADVIVDQLNYGRYGATAREGMMLGRPTVCYINKAEPPGADRLEAIETCPLVSATEESIYDVLKDLLSNEAKRRAIGEASRAFALKWHSADACAERFEQVYDRLMAGLPPATRQTAAAAQ